MRPNSRTNHRTILGESGSGAPLSTTEETMSRERKRGNWFGRATWALLSGMFLSTGFGCKDALKVTNPQSFATELLDNARILPAVANGVEGTLQQNYDLTVVYTGLLSDELEDSSTWINWANMSAGRFGPGSQDDQGANGPHAQIGLLRTRFAAQDAAARITRVLKGDAATSPLMAQVKTAEAWADLYLAMVFCESPLVANGPAAPDSAVYRQALTKLTAAISLANAAGAGANAVKNWALAGRARTNLFLGNFDAAAADAAAVPPDFVKQALFSTNSSTSFAGNQLNQNRNRSGTLRRAWWPMVDTTSNGQVPPPDQFVKDPWSMQDDPRMVVLHPRGRLGVNNQTLSYSIQKYKDYTAPETMTSKAEMNLIEAEVFWRKGDLPSAITKLNIGRTAAGLPPFAMPLSADDVFQRLLSERFAQLFIEGHRLTDLDRFNLITARLGAGRARKYQMSQVEIVNNPSITPGDQKCPGKS